MEKKYKILSHDAPGKLGEGKGIFFNIKVEGRISEEEARRLVEEDMDYEYITSYSHKGDDKTVILCRYWMFEIGDGITESLRAYMKGTEEQIETDKR